MSINNREDVNKYYQIINELVDDYIDKWKIKPSRLGNYLKPGSDRFNKFLVRNNLSEIKGSEIILKDVVEDRVHMENDGVMKFESFSLFESNGFKIDSMKECLYKGIEKANINMEKLLADVFDTNLGSIDIIDADKHIFKIEDWEGENIKVIIYSQDDLDLIKSNIIDSLYDQLLKKDVELTDKISIGISDLVKEDEFYKKMNDKLNKDLLNEIISDLLSNFKLKGENSGYYIWME